MHSYKDLLFMQLRKAKKGLQHPEFSAVCYLKYNKTATSWKKKINRHLQVWGFFLLTESPVLADTKWLLRLFSWQNRWCLSAFTVRICSKSTKNKLKKWRIITLEPIQLPTLEIIHWKHIRYNTFPYSCKANASFFLSIIVY